MTLIGIFLHARDEEPVSLVDLTTRDNLIDDSVVYYNSRVEKFMIHPTKSLGDLKSKIKEYANAA